MLDGRAKDSYERMRSKVFLYFRENLEKEGVHFGGPNISMVIDSILKAIAEEINGK